MTYTYKGVNMDRLKNMSVGAGPGGGKQWFQPKEVGVYQVRILPEVGKMDYWVIEHHMHNSTDGSQSPYGGLKMTAFQTADGYNRKITCKRFHGNEECPLCDLVDWLKQEDYDGDLIKAMVPTRNFYMNVLDRSDNTVKVWGAGVGEFNAVKKAMSLRKKDPLHPQTGCDILIQKTARRQGGKDTNCGWDEEASPIGLNGWDTMASDLTDIIKIFTLEETLDLMQRNLGGLYPLKKFFGGGELVERKAPTKKAATKKTSKKK